MKRKHQSVADRTWTDRDSALWHTCEIAVDVAEGRPPRHASEVLAPFPPAMDAAAEHFWAAGPFTLLSQVAAGDGRYRHNGGVFLATGRGGLALTAGLAATRALGNASRRRAAAAAAVPRWTPVDRGDLYISGFGFYLHTDQAVLQWPWPSVNGATMVGPGQVHLLGSSSQGPVSWVLHADWAELLFVLWALVRHPRHPQLLSGAWLPPGWLEWAAGQRCPTRLTTPVLIARG